MVSETSDEEDELSSSEVEAGTGEDELGSSEVEAGTAEEELGAGEAVCIPWAFWALLSKRRGERSFGGRVWFRASGPQILISLLSLILR